MRLLLTSLLVLAAGMLPAQTGGRTISGQVVCDENSQPVEGVTVKVKGSTKTSGTQADGVYYITVSEADSVLVFSFPEYRVKEVKINSGSQLDVRLERAGDSGSADKRDNGMVTVLVRHQLHAIHTR